MFIKEGELPLPIAARRGQYPSRKIIFKLNCETVKKKAVRRIKESRAFEIKKAWNSAYCTSGTGIPSNNKRAHAVRREHRTYYLVAKITSFLVRDSKRMLQM